MRSPTAAFSGEDGLRSGTGYDVVVPTLGRPSLQALLDSLGVAAAGGPGPARVLVVDDRKGPAAVLDLQVPAALDGRVRVLRGRGGAGPAAARNVGWRSGRAPWAAFLDDDVLVPPDWCAALAGDLSDLGGDVAGSQGRIEVPLPAGRRPTDWERNTAGLARARWATADMAYRRSVLLEVGGFDERFPRAYREDADLALRVLAAGHELVHGDRRVLHPVRPADFWVSVRVQAGNRDDVLIRRRHGRSWREQAGALPGRFTRHAVVTAAGATALTLAAARRPHPATAAALLWAAGTGEFAATRIRPGPRTPAEVTRMVVTSAVLPAAAVRHRLAAELSRDPGPWRPPPAAVLFDRDGTLVRDVPYNDDPARVTPMPGAAAALDRVRKLGIPVGVLSNQSGVARGLLTPEQVEAVNARVEELLGPFDVWRVCPHGPDDGCGCRKPAPGMVVSAARALGVPVTACVLVGDIAADIEAAEAAGARGVLVPTPATRPDEVAAAPTVAGDLLAAVETVLR